MLEAKVQELMQSKQIIEEIQYDNMRLKTELQTRH